MLVQSTASLMIYCLQAGSHIPDHIQEYMNKIFELADSPEPALIVTHTMMLFCGLRADVMQGKITDPHAILARALELDGILVVIAEVRQTARLGVRLHDAVTDAPVREILRIMLGQTAGAAQQAKQH